MSIVETLINIWVFCKPDGALTLGTTTFNIMTLGIKGLHMTLAIATLCHYAE
jgi:hypothetical protein